MVDSSKKARGWSNNYLLVATSSQTDPQDISMGAVGDFLTHARFSSFLHKLTATTTIKF